MRARIDDTPSRVELMLVNEPGTAAPVGLSAHGRRGRPCCRARRRAKTAKARRAIVALVRQVVAGPDEAGESTADVFLLWSAPQGTPSITVKTDKIRFRQFWRSLRNMLLSGRVLYRARWMSSVCSEALWPG
jgi:hypothetical protein